MENNRPLNELMTETIQKIRESVDANTVVGDPIKAGDVTLIPVSKVSFGFGTGGSEFQGKVIPSNGDRPFGGGGGAGVKVTPVCFLSVTGTNVKVLPMTAQPETSLDRVLDLIPDLVDKISEQIEKRKAEKKHEVL